MADGWFFLGLFNPTDLNIDKCYRVAGHILTEIQSIAESTKYRSQELPFRMEAVKYAMLSNHEGFINSFVEFWGISKLMTLLDHPMTEIVLAVLDTLPTLFSIENAVHYMLKRPELFTWVYENLDSPEQ